MLNIPRKARGPDWNPSRAGLWGPLGQKDLESIYSLMNAPESTDKNLTHA